MIFFWKEIDHIAKDRYEQEAIHKAETESKIVWNRIGWRTYLVKAIESKCFGQTIAEVSMSDTYEVLKYFGYEKAMIT